MRRTIIVTVMIIVVLEVMVTVFNVALKVIVMMVVPKMTVIVASHPFLCNGGL